MARTKISEFSPTPGNNTDIDGINIAENCPPSSINNAIRELMAQLKDWQSGTSNDPYVVGSSGSLTLSYGTANGVAYLNGSKVLTTGSALTFDGTDLATTGGVRLNNSQYYYGKNAAGTAVRLMGINSGNVNYIGAIDSGPTDAIYGAASTFTNQAWYVGGSEQMRLTSTGLGIGTSSPGQKLQVESGTPTTNVRVVSSPSPSLIFSGFEATRTGVAAGALMRSFRDGAVGGVGWEWLTTVDNSGETAGTYTSRMILDRSGNLGLGVTPSAWVSSWKALDVTSGGSSLFGSLAIGGIATNCFFDSGATWRYKTSFGASRFEQSSNGSMTWHQAPSGTAGNAISFTQAMTLDASGNLGVGTTSPVAKLDVLGGNARVALSGGSASTLRGYEIASATTVFASLKAESTTGEFRVDAGFSGFGGYTTFYTAGSERARIDLSGNMGIGTTTPGAKLNVVTAGTALANFTGAQYSQIRHSDGTRVLYTQVYDNAAAFGTESSTPLLFVTGGAERARIDSSGNFIVGGTVSGIGPFAGNITTGALFVNATSMVSGSASVINVEHNGGGYYGIMLKNRSTTISNALTFVNSSDSVVGSVQTTTTATIYNTVSDYRLKENIAPMTGALAKVAALKPVTYTWKSTGEDAQGFIAHELQEVCPQAVSGEKDGLDSEGNLQYQGIDTSFLVATLTAAIQEQQALITALTARITALESN